MKAVVVWLLVVSAAPAADRVAIRFPKERYRAGEAVKATVVARGELTVENDIQQRSFAVKGEGEREVDLGPITKPGLYTVRVVGKDGAVAAVLLVHPADRGVALAVQTRSAEAPPAVSADLLDRLARGMTRARLETATRKALRAWLPRNASSLGTTATLCTVCVVPGGQFACPACASSAGSNAVDLGLAVLLEVVKELEAARALTAQEARTLRLVIEYGGGGFAVLNAGGKLERALEAVKFVVEATVEHEGVTAVVGNGADQVSKANLLIKLTKKP